MNDVIYLTKEYLEIKKELYDKKIDLTFLPEKLDKLTDEERLEVEDILINYCVLGISSSFNYIPYFKFRNPSVIVDTDMFDKLSNGEQLLIMKNLFIHSENIEYFEYIYNKASFDIEAYDMLLDICIYLKNNGNDVSLFYDDLLKMANNDTDDNIYQFLYDNKLKR